METTSETVYQMYGSGAFWNDIFYKLPKSKRDAMTHAEADEMRAFIDQVESGLTGHIQNYIQSLVSGHYPDLIVEVVPPKDD